jgi:ribosomal protein L7/L12
LAGDFRCYDEGRKMVLVYFGIVLACVLVIMKIFMGRNIENPPENLTDDEILNIARAGKKIQAIKWYRSLHNVGLKDAKKAVEEMILKS